MAAMKRRVFDSSSDEDSQSDTELSFLGDDTTDDEVTPNSENLDPLSKSFNRMKIENKPPPSSHGKLNRGISDSESESDSDESFGSFSPPKTKKKVATSFASSSAFLLDDDSSSSSEDDDDSQTSVEGPTVKWFTNPISGDYSVRSRGRGPKLPKLSIPKKLFEKLFDYQVDAVAWMAQLHAKEIGGLLGDDMGMGKTFMTCALLGGLMRAKTIKNALILAPLSVLRSWEKEVEKVIGKCVRNVVIEVVTSVSAKAKRTKQLQNALGCSKSQPHIVISTYGLVTSGPDSFTHEKRAWNYVVLDEAHTVRNPATRISKNVRLVCESEKTRRLMLTGTPIMNNLKELWALFDFCTSGEVLGSLRDFTQQFAKPIEAARASDSTNSDLQQGDKANSALQARLKPFFLQRFKIDYLADRLPKKREFVVWTHLSEKQRDWYTGYVSSQDSAVAQYLSGESNSPLAAITWLKKLCAHPILVDKESKESNLLDTVPTEVLKQNSSKLLLLDALVENLQKGGHHTLIFSQSTKMLDIIQRVLHRLKMLRIDGNTKGIDRQRFVDDFNDPAGTYQVMLLSTKAAGVGLTLTGADRVIVYDPSWNPAEDSQAIDRAYRIGQEREVTVFRFISAGTVEEYMYEKQIYKDGIRRAVMTSSGSTTERYFEKYRGGRIFKLANKGECAFLKRLEDKGLSLPKESQLLALNVHSGVAGVSSHDLVYSKAAILHLTESEGTTRTIAPSQKNPFATASNPLNSPLGSPPGSKGKTDGKVAASVPSVMGPSQRILFQGENPTNVVLPGTKPTSGISTATNVKEQEQKPGDVGSFKMLIEQANKKAAEGDYTTELSILMDIMQTKYQELDTTQQMEVHRRISHNKVAMNILQEDSGVKEEK